MNTNRFQVCLIEKTKHVYFLRKILQKTKQKNECIVNDDCDKMNQLKEKDKALKEQVDRLNTILAKFT